MEYRYHDLKAYNLHLFKTDKFNTITIMINFRNKIIKDEITIRSFIHRILLLSSKKYPSERLLSKEAENLYGPFINSNEIRAGNYTITSFTMNMINEKYTEDDMNDKCMDFFKEILFNPDVENDAFNNNSFNIVKNEIQAKLRSIKDNPRYYSKVRMLEYMDPNSPLSYRSGYLEDLDNIDAHKVYEYYKKMLHSDLIDVFVLGDFDFVDMKNLIIDMIPVNTVKRVKNDLYINHKTLPKRLKKCFDIEKVSQAKLVIGCKIGKLTPFERNYVLPIYTDILGGPSYSKLFRSVREKHSLAYYIHANYHHGDNILTIASGINKESYDKTLKLIKEQINDMSRSNIDKEELSRAQEDMISIIKACEDKPLLVLNRYKWQFLFDLDDLEKRKKEFLNVKIDDVKNISKKIAIDTVYLLHGGDNNEEDSH